MKTFNEKIKEVKNRRLFLAICILIIAFIIFVCWIIEIVPKNINYEEFRKYEKSSNYAKTTVYYLIGPLVEVKSQKDDSITLGYYIAVGKDDDLFIVRANKNNIEIPILGENIEEGSVDTLEGVEVYGKVELASYSLRNVLYNRLNTIFNENIVNDQSFDEVLGGYYLDTAPDRKSNATQLLMLTAFFAVIGILYILINKRIQTRVDESINELKTKGKLEEVIGEFESEKLIDYKRLKVYLSPNYIFSYCSGFDVIAFKDIKEVTTSKNSIGSRNKNKYIVITTKDDREYYIAPIQKKKEKVIFNELLTKIKSVIE